MSASNDVILLVGGLGSRLRSVVRDVPKPMAPVAGRPFLTYLLDQLAEQGVHNAILATGYMGDVVERTLGARWKTVNLLYSHEREPLGTGGALQLASRKLTSERFVVMNGDTYVTLDLAAFADCARQHRGSLGVALAHVDDTARYGAVMLHDDRVTGFTEKGRNGSGYINAGVYLLDRVTVGQWCKGERFSFEADVVTPMAAGGNVWGYTATRDFIDIGVPEDYARAQQQFGER
jgi:D-glycero-alpha-D-manno-heptose 1-phosphate guanylyltransferase